MKKSYYSIANVNFVHGHKLNEGQRVDVVTSRDSREQRWYAAVIVHPAVKGEPPTKGSYAAPIDERYIPKLLMRSRDYVQLQHALIQLLGKTSEEVSGFVGKYSCCRHIFLTLTLLLATQMQRLSNEIWM